MARLVGRLLGVGLTLAASAAAAAPPLANPFHVSEFVAPPSRVPEMRFKMVSPRMDYSEPARPERRKGFLASVQVSRNGFLGIGMSGTKPRKSSMGPDPARDGRRGSKKLALKFNLDF